MNTKLIKAVSLSAAALMCISALAGCGNSGGDTGSTSKTLKVIEDPEVFEAEEYAIAVKKGNTELLDTINKTLADMKQNGEIEALAEKYNSIDADTSAKSSENTAAPEAAGGKLIMGTNAAFQPFEFTTTNGLLGQFDGIDVAIAMKIAENADKTLEIADMEFDGLIAAVSTGKVDMAVAGMTVTEERQQSVDFSDPYYTASQVIIVSDDNTSITKASDLVDKKVGVVLGYTGDNIVTDTLKVPEANIRRANRAIDLVQDVKNGKLDAVVVDSYTGKALVEKYNSKTAE